MKVYLLSDYGEYGSEGVVATTDPTLLPEMLKERYAEGNHVPSDDQLRRLAEFVGSGEIYRDGQDLQDGWGGTQLHVVEIRVEIRTRMYP